MLGQESGYEWYDKKYARFQREYYMEYDQNKELEYSLDKNYERIIKILRKIFSNEQEFFAKIPRHILYNAIDALLLIREHLALKLNIHKNLILLSGDVIPSDLTDQPYVLELILFVPKTNVSTPISLEDYEELWYENTPLDIDEYFIFTINWDEE